MLTAAALTALPAAAQQAPAPPAPAVYSLADAVTLALRSNAQIQAAQSAVRAADAQVRVARAGQVPAISLSASGAATGSGATGSVSTNVTYLVFDGGLREAQIRQAEAAAESARQSLEATRSDVALLAVQSFMAVVVAQQLVVLREQGLAQVRTQLRAAEANFRAGTVPRADVIRAESQVATAEFELVDARGQVDVRRTALRTVMALDAPAPLAVAAPGPPPPLEVSEADALQRAVARPEVRRAEADVRGREAALAAAMIQGGVTATVDGRYILATTGGTSGGSNWSLGLGISVPLFDGGRKAAQVEEARANLDGSRARLSGELLAARQDAVQTRLQVLSSAARVVAAQRAAAAAREAARVAQGRYQAGVGTVIEIATAQTDLVAAEATLVQVTADRWTAIAALRRALAMPVLP